MTLVLASSMDLKEFKLFTVCSLVLEEIKPIQFVGQVAEFMFEFIFEPLLVLWQSLPQAIPISQKTIDGFEFKINGLALGPAQPELWHSFGQHPQALGTEISWFCIWLANLAKNQVSSQNTANSSPARWQPVPSWSQQLNWWVSDDPFVGRTLCSPHNAIVIMPQLLVFYCHSDIHCWRTFSCFLTSFLTVCAWQCWHLVCYTFSYQGCGSATHFRDCHTKKKTKKTCSHLVTCLPIAPACILPGETQNLCFANYKKCRSHTPDLNMDSCFLPMQPPFFLAL